MFKTKFNSELLEWTGPERTVTYESDETIGKAVLRALDGPERVVQVCEGMNELLLIY